MLRWPFYYLFSPHDRNAKDEAKLPLDYELSNLAPDQSICLVGDIMGIGNKSFDLDSSLLHFLKGSDYLVGNLECLISDRKGVNLIRQSTTAKNISNLSKLIGKTKLILSLANNHSGDLGEQGLRQTQKYLDELKISYFGHKDCYQIKLGEVILSGATGWIGKDRSLVTTLDEVDNTTGIGFYHWGDEFVTSLDTRSLEFEKLQTKASVIIGHHPHIPHIPILKNNRPFFSSLGNFWISFGGSAVTNGIIVKLNFNKEELVSYSWRYICCDTMSTGVKVRVGSRS
jgi:poly-gamma-glutamate synthesis protein (capsule biosynthesis protein)